MCRSGNRITSYNVCYTKLLRWADVQFVGDVVDRRVGFTLVVEQQQARDEDAVAGVSAHTGTMGQFAAGFNGFAQIPAIRNFSYQAAYSPY